MNPVPSRDTEVTAVGAPAQRALERRQIEAFYHDNFVSTQVADFNALVRPRPGLGVLDVGGGCGYFAAAVAGRYGCRTRVIDTDPASVAACHGRGVTAEVGDALAPPPRGDEQVVCFNLILHHLVGCDERATTQLQREALATWGRRTPLVFVNEYVYDPIAGDISGRLIYAITHSRILSAAARVVSRFVPSLRANTFGVGVRFRSRSSWLKLFEDAGLTTLAECRGDEEDVSAARRLLLIRSCRRDSFLLAFDPAVAAAIHVDTHR